MIEDVPLPYTCTRDRIVYRRSQVALSTNKSHRTYWLLRTCKYDQTICGKSILLNKTLKDFVQAKKCTQLLRQNFIIGLECGVNIFRTMYQKMYTSPI